MIIKNYEPNKINLNKTKFVLLYGENTGAKEDFTKIILKEKYDKLREKYNAKERFMDIYEKITYRNDSRKRSKKTMRSKLFTFFGKQYLKQINKNKEKLIKKI